MIPRFKKIIFVATATILVSKNVYTPVLVNFSPTEIFQSGQVFEMI